MALERPTSEEGVANLALGRCKEDEIATFDDDLNRARVARRHFGLVRDALLARLDWNFASAWDTPAADTVASSGPLATRFVLPADCVVVRQVFLTDMLELGNDEWEIATGRVTIASVEAEAKVLLCNYSSIKVRYTRKVTSPRLWDPLFMDAFVCLYAAAMAPELGKSTSMAAALLQEAEGLLVPLAKRVDSREKAATQVGGTKLTSWIAARGGYPFRRPWW
jgi:hypothetical protein